MYDRSVNPDVDADIDGPPRRPAGGDDEPDPPASSSSPRRRSVEFHRFLMLLSVRPGRCLLILAHALPSRPCSSSSVSSSVAVQAALTIAGSRWLSHRSRHCLPMRLEK